ncbi:hypothetical protein [Aliarcobacter lanthieri]|uniref:hypothetical protein n=1 Tax=Aliarcobacter lanthieri TaxID=1355374 RepID=UPI000478F679|nr:hypothetical protein [Aliarcobacter lanthieri]QKF59267.1 hypothetical protein ALANTH_1158 [Aliarcobacter lanthieri]
MRFINPEEFDFVEHWQFDDKKYIAAFFYKLKNSYPNIEDEEYVSYIKYRIFIEYKKKDKNLVVNSSLIGKLRMELYRTNKRNLENNYNIEAYSICFIEKFMIDEHYDENDFTDFLIDIERICCSKTKDALLKKINGENLTRNDFKILKNNRDKIVEYLNI